jgi:GT2 family glycosyltransferase
MAKGLANIAGMAVEIVIPTYNRPDKLRECLIHLARLDGGPYPTTVVDDGSDHPLDTVCADFGDWVSLVRQENAGPGAARNAGARAVGDVDLIAFTDDDCRPRPDWLVRLVAAQGGVPRRLVGGAVENALAGNVFSSASQALCSFLYEYYQSHGSAMTFFTTNNMCCRRDDFLALGGFDQNFAIASEDRDFSLRWRDAGGQLGYEPGAIIDHAHDLSFGQFWRQHSNYGRGARTLHRTMDSRGDARPKIEALAFYLGMVSYPLRRRLRRPLTQMFLVGLSQVAMIAGYARAINDERKPAFS